MAMQTIKNGGFVAEEIGKINDNFALCAEKTTFTTNSWTSSGDQVTFTTAANSKVPSVVMRKNGSNYGIALVDVQLVGTNVVITSDEAFEGYVMLV